MDALRKAYHRAVQIPLDNVERLWQDYEAFETGLNRITASVPGHYVQKTVLTIDIGEEIHG
jgi:cleavage stimulation factor subunit 3